MGVEFNERPETPDETGNADIEEIKYADTQEGGSPPKRSGSVVNRKTQAIDLNRLKHVDPELTEILAEMDLDGDGTINAAELNRAFEIIRDTRKDKDEWQKVAFRRLVMFIIALVINVALIGVVTYYIVWSTAAVRIDEDGNLVNKHEADAAEDDDEEAVPAPIVTQAYEEEEHGLNDLFDHEQYSDISEFSYPVGDDKTVWVRPTGFSTFEREAVIPNEDDTLSTYKLDVVVAYVDGTTAIVIENPISEPYDVNPLIPYTITGVKIGEMDATDPDNKLRDYTAGTTAARRLSGKPPLKSAKNEMNIKEKFTVSNRSSKDVVEGKDIPRKSATNRNAAVRNGKAGGNGRSANKSARSNKGGSKLRRNKSTKNGKNLRQKTDKRSNRRAKSSSKKGGK